MAQRYVSTTQWGPLIGLLIFANSAGGQTFPHLQPGLWEYQRTTQRSDQDWVPKDVSERVCGDPNDMLKKQTETFAKRGCKITTEQTKADIPEEPEGETTEKSEADTTYRLTAECTTKNGEKVVSQSVTVFNGDSQYTSVIDSSGRLAGAPVQFAERVVAKRVGDCKQQSP